jgi:mannose/fructose/N-acetylgalactosamine-specific phosphotransferase system component IID
MTKQLNEIVPLTYESQKKSHCMKHHLEICDECVISGVWDFETPSSVESEKEHEYAVRVKLLPRLFDIYTKDRKEKNTPQSYIDFFKAEHYVLTEVEKAREEVHQHYQSEIEKIIEKYKEDDIYIIEDLTKLIK